MTLTASRANHYALPVRQAAARTVITTITTPTIRPVRFVVFA